MITRSVAILGLALGLAACAPTQLTQPLSADPEPSQPPQAEPDQTEPPLSTQPEPTLEQPAVEQAPEPGPVAVAEPDPVPPPAWWFPEVREAGERAILAPGLSDAPTLLEARAGALAVARARVDTAAASWPSSRADEAVRNAASATLPDGTFRYWVILYAQPRR